MRGGRVLANGPTETVLTPDHVRAALRRRCRRPSPRSYRPPDRGARAPDLTGEHAPPHSSSWSARSRWSAARGPALGADRRQHTDFAGAGFDASIPWADNVDAQIFFVARLPRVLAGALVGAALAAAGVVLQAMLRNPLATPFTLGVSAGAALGAMLAIAWRVEVGRSASRRCRSQASWARSWPRPSSTGWPRPAQRALHQRAAAGRGDTQLLLLGPDPVRAVPRRLRGVVPRRSAG